MLYFNQTFNSICAGARQTMRIEADIDELIKLVSSVTEAYTTAFFTPPKRIIIEVDKAQFRRVIPILNQFYYKHSSNI